MDLLEIIVKVGFLGIYFLFLDLVFKVVVRNFDVFMMIDWLLCFFFVYLVCICRLVNDKEEREFRVYGLGKVGRKFIKDEDRFFLVFIVCFINFKFEGDMWYEYIK